MRVLGAPSAPRPRTSDGSPSMAATACLTASASSRRRPFIGRPTAFLDIELCPLRRGGPQVPPGPSSRCSLCLYRSLNIGVPPNPIFGEIYMMPAGTPILVLKEGTGRELGARPGGSAAQEGGRSDRTEHSSDRNRRALPPGGGQGAGGPREGRDEDFRQGSGHPQEGRDDRDVLEVRQRAQGVARRHLCQG